MLSADYQKTLADLRLKVSQMAKQKDRPLLYHITTYGCLMNEHDSEKLRGILETIGYQPAAKEDEADIVLYNTCAIRDGAEQKVYGRLGYLKTVKRRRPEMLIALCGCMTQQKIVLDKLQKTYRHVDIIFGTHNIYMFAELLMACLETGEQIIDIWDKHQEIVEDLPIIRDNPYKASVNIMYGCNNFCSFCIVPYVRGRERSRPSADVVAEVRELVAQGVVEIMLLGQNVNSYGHGLEEDINFTGLLRKLEEIDGLKRLRFMTSHPKDLSDELIEFIGISQKLCPQFHLPMQSGSNKVLKEMNRHYSQEHFMELVAKLRKARPDIAISTDIIVGFPGETEEDFAQTLEVAEKAEFDMAYTFIYSPRTGTRAAAREDKIPDEVSKERFGRLLKVVNQNIHKKSVALLDTIQPVLAEGIGENGKIRGRLNNNHLIHFDGDASLLGKIVDVKIVKARTFYLMGELVNHG
ncbi:tRNA (N6-isopentenyl adenosine(37)-C2)-methylthiotransferase MiaB [Clostridiales bacterium COT073_COT-073]|nr:tRNA (N6-isopentenyl adenosine(37)-C2)-methylthiotransferase MiaB [Clostridiales bacterium COT073_COT-073]